MSAFKNMKIEINESQPLDDVVAELERVGAKQCGYIKNHGFIVSNGELYTWCSSKSIDALYDDHDLTTLAQLKEMK